MIPENLTATLYSIVTYHPLLTLGVAFVLAIFLWKKPMDFLKFALMAAILFGGIYAAMQFGQSAKSVTHNKHIMATETEKKMSEQ
ncbi:hypothetical protein [Desulfopila aestuarii]|uniref:Uncharacterized protein n=1 Tax=Desulfopila aestuarii DSM 18488 TaxID=1121416 RepID=A0A1M7YLC9_9BACT|nr:hypothetical protein [Desulfopila aestuarii]SHO53433.1 hypothetical protein SAMN02745220_05116 [Desulfopila aestuarii DSM 18488]